MTRLPMPGTLDLPAAARFADTLRSTLGPVLLNGADVERIGVAGLQLLLSAQATAHGSGHVFGIEHPSEVLSAAVRTAGANCLLASDC